jgi:hypothetical protein
VDLSSAAELDAMQARILAQAMAGSTQEAFRKKASRLIESDFDH